MTPPLRIHAHGATDVGDKRSINEDTFGLFPELGLYLVLDGVGGVASGETAARLALAAVRRFFEETRQDPTRPWPFKMDRRKSYEENRLIAGIRIANQAVLTASRSDPALRGMGTTIVAVSIVNDRVQLAHVGDSRIYRRRGEQLEQLTQDHSLVNEMLRNGQLSPEEYESFPHKNVIVRALGMVDSVEVDTRVEDAAPGDVYLLCTDGLHGVVDDRAILSVLLENEAFEAAAAKLIARANENGGPDNVTCLLVGVDR